MSDYDFSTLNDKDFEILVVNLLSAEFGIKIERFKAGKDGGVDGRFFSDGNKENIIQCKHWLKTGEEKLIKALEDVEYEKVKKIAPKSYLVATSVPLSRNNKTKIYEIFKDYMESSSQVLGQEDLNDLLKKHPAIEKNHYKLWFSSTHVLEKILHKGVYTASHYKLEEIRENIKKFVVVQNYEKAIEKLEKMHAVIISGIPGIGKTTLAEHLVLYYENQGYEFFSIESSINEIENIYDAEKKQIFYFDDFLGSTFLEAIDGNNDAKILSFIYRISKDQNKKFILTSRTNILNRGKFLSTKFSDKNIDQNEFELRIEDITRLEKAKILYNHIYFTGLSDEMVEELYTDKRYKIIIDHPNFNPRIIDFITNKNNFTDMISKEYWTQVLLSLNYPEQIWSKVFENSQIDQISIDVVVAIVLSAGSINENALMIFINRLVDKRYGNDPKYTFNYIVKNLCGSLLNRNRNEISNFYTLFNPSIADYVLRVYLSNINYINEIILLLNDLNSLKYLISLKNNNLLTFDNFNLICDQVIDFELSKKDPLKSLVFVRKFQILKKYRYFDESFKQYLIGKDRCFFDLSEDDIFVEQFDIVNYMVAEKIWNLNYQENISYLEKFEVLLDDMDFYELIRISKFISNVGIHENEIIVQKIKVIIVKYCSEGIHQWVVDDDVLNDVVEDYQYDEGIVVQYVNETLANFSLNFSEQDYEKIFEEIDVHSIISTNQEAFAESSYHEDEAYAKFKEDQLIFGDMVDPIEELFDRN